MERVVIDRDAGQTVVGCRQSDLTADFVKTNVGYYRRQFALIGRKPGFSPSLNVAAGLAGSIWFGARGLWAWFLPLLVIEVFALTQMANGLWGDLDRGQRIRAENIARTLQQRRQQIEDALRENLPVDGLQRAIESLEQALIRANQEAAAASETGFRLVLTGLTVLLAVRLVQATIANWALERRFTAWRSNRSLPAGLSWWRAFVALMLVLAISGLTALRFSRPEAMSTLAAFPAATGLRNHAGQMIANGFSWLKDNCVWVFDSISFSLRWLLGGLEAIFVGTPWPVAILIICMLAWLSAGTRVAIFSVAALTFLGLMGFWEKAMMTISLLGTAALISITLGVPLGIFCASRPRVYAVIRPLLDFMQSMPSFVYLIPVIAFFGIGAPAAVAATLIFGSPPVIRFTVLGLQSVPEATREAAAAFGATPMYSLFKVELPLAAPTIMAGINQTILMSLSMVVVASLIGAKGLGEDVLQALQYAQLGQGVLAGLAILFCAMILDRIVQGSRSSR